jgi:hypothetical protein
MGITRDKQHAFSAKSKRYWTAQGARRWPLSVRAIAAKVGVGVGTVHRVIKGEHVSQI